jgi:hypothetical protein
MWDVVSPLTGPMRSTIAQTGSSLPPATVPAEAASAEKATPAVPAEAQVDADRLEPGRVASQAVVASALGAAGTYGGMLVGAELGLAYGMSLAAGPAVVQALIALTAGLAYAAVGAAAGGALLGAAAVAAGTWLGGKLFDTYTNTKSAEDSLGRIQQQFGATKADQLEP